jgi:hypothetical protein
MNDRHCTPIVLMVRHPGRRREVQNSAYRPYFNEIGPMLFEAESVLGPEVRYREPYSGRLPVVASVFCLVIDMQRKLVQSVDSAKGAP